MTSPYTHPSMPGTRYLGESIPGHVTASPARTPGWITVEEALQATSINHGIDDARRAFILNDALHDTEGQHLVQNILDRKAQETA